MNEHVEALWKKVTESGNPVLSDEGKREADGSYVRGFRHHFERWSTTLRGFTLTAIRAEQSSFTLSIDVYEVTRRIEILKDGVSVCKLRKMDIRRESRFTEPGEMFLGTDTTQDEGWTISGKLPPDLIRLVRQPQLDVTSTMRMSKKSA